MTSSRLATRRLVLLSMLAACGLVIFVFESFLPVLPWFRPGFGNVATILALMFFGFSDALKVTVLRVFLGALVLGRLFTPVFVFAFGGGIASVVVMALVMRYTGRVFGPVGISIFGALAHNVAQVVIAWLLFVRSGELFMLLPVFIAAAVATGMLTGLVSAVVYEKSEKRLGFESFGARAAPDSGG